MIRRSFILLAMTLTASGCTFTGLAQEEAESSKVCIMPDNQPDLVDEVLALVNEARLDEGLAPLVLDPVLSDVADAFACEMIAGEFFAHENPRTRVSAGGRLTSAGYIYYAMGENLAVGHTTPEEVVAAWLASPDHRSNLLDPSWQEVGIAVRTGGEFGWYWVQEFADPVEWDAVDATAETTPAEASSGLEG
jgi:uncharacterized protein YkwD